MPWIAVDLACGLIYPWVEGSVVSNLIGWCFAVGGDVVVSAPVCSCLEIRIRRFACVVWSAYIYLSEIGLSSW